MKRFFILALFILQSWSSFSQNTFDSISDSISAFFKEFHLSVDAGLNHLIPSTTDLHRQSEMIDFHYAIGISDSKYYHHSQWDIAVATESSIVKWRLAMVRDYLDYEYYGATFEADYLRAALSLQFFIWKRRSLHILFGPSLELGWITHYVYSKDGVTMNNPDIGQTTGINLLFPLTILFPISKHSRIYFNLASGVHLRDDHEVPYFDHWGRHGYGPEAELKSYCPFSVGLGYSFLIN